MEGVGVDPAEVSSPTFAIVHEYDGAVPVLHLDLYRLESEDLPNLCLDERIDDHLAYQAGIVLVEWANKHPMVLPEAALQIDIQLAEDDQRVIQVRGPIMVITQLETAWKNR